MCGIVGYTGMKQAVDVLIEGLSNLEYRGYDSAGVSVLHNNIITTMKSKGRLQNLVDKFSQGGKPVGTCGIGHTRWATHGGPSDVNSHPHATEKISLVHNGIIENYQEIKEKLTGQGYHFTSETDTECAAKLIDSLYGGDPVQAIRKALGQIEGSYAFAAVFTDFPETVFATRQNSPLIIAVGEGENFIASDVPAILCYTRKYHLLEEGEIAVVRADEILVYSAEDRLVEKLLYTANWTVEQAQKGGYEHFMLKEIYEQPTVLLDTVHPRIAHEIPDFHNDNISEGFFTRFSRIHIIACGTAMHAGMLGRGLIEKLSRTPIEVDMASEFRYRNPILNKDELVIVISQSGETADSLAALRMAKDRGLTTLAIVNVAGSSIARMADHVIHTYAGPEISVASTKAYSVQLSVMYLIAIRTAYDKGLIDLDETKRLTRELLHAIELTKQALELDELIEQYAHRFEKTENLFFIGRNLDYYLSLEGSLKLKEISYIHCEAYAAGELKHGTISLITDEVPVVAVITQDALLAKTVSNIKEVKSRGADVLLICKEGTNISEDVYDRCLSLPSLDDFFMPLIGVIPLQLLAYHTAVARGCDVDKPRNLAKSVTVE